MCSLLWMMGVVTGSRGESAAAASRLKLVEEGSLVMPWQARHVQASMCCEERENQTADHVQSPEHRK